MIRPRPRDSKANATFVIGMRIRVRQIEPKASDLCPLVFRVAFVIIVMQARDLEGGLEFVCELKEY